MITLIKQWLLHRQIHQLGNAVDFAEVDPAAVLSVLEELAHVRADGTDSTQDEYRSIVASRHVEVWGGDYQRAILNVWELAKARYLAAGTDRDSWRQVMALCNALYDVRHGPTSVPAAA